MALFTITVLVRREECLIWKQKVSGCLTPSLSLGHPFMNHDGTYKNRRLSEKKREMAGKRKMKIKALSYSLSDVSHT